MTQTQTQMPMQTQTVQNTQQQLIELVDNLASKIPMNGFGMPEFIYRADIFPQDYQSLSKDQKSAYLRAATVPLFYSDGFPTTEHGALFWDRLDIESDTDHHLFLRYREMSNSLGYRSVEVLARKLADETHAANRLSNNRARSGDSDRDAHRDMSLDPNNEYLNVQVPTPPTSIPGAITGATATSTTPDDLAEYEELLQSTRDYLRAIYTFYFWKFRANAFDLVGEAAVRRIRQTRALLLDDRTYIRLQATSDKLFQRLNRFTDQDFDSMDPMDTTKVLKEILSMQRVSVGLPAAAPADSHLPGDRDSTAATNVEEHLRSIARNKRQVDSGNIDALSDPQTTELAQNLIIRMMQKKEDSGDN